MSDETVVMDEDVRGEARPGGGYAIPAAPRGGRRGFEMWSWVFMRVSGLLLVFMALYHLFWWNLYVGVEHLSAELVLERWNDPLWRLFNVGLAAFALLHGLNGLRYSIEDYVPRRHQTLVKRIAYTVVLLTLAWGVFALLTYDFASGARR